MKRLVIAVVGTALALAATARAGEIEGLLACADAGRKQVRLDTGTRLTIDAETSITLNGRPSRLEDLPPGAEVRASYEQKDGQRVATTLHVTEE